MPKPLVMTISHELGKEEAKRRLQNGVGQMRAQLAPLTSSLDHQWMDDRLSFHMVALGQRIAGHIDVLEEAVRVELQLPGVLGWLGEKIGRRIQRQASLMLDKPKAPS
ncbi:MAG TPA: polyhydroxyalkanoic acid system family protein [Methylomirabilota bacterium]|jgi:putative polyhydroxyalkanoic acid system protein|nr:polyhydroxyalkanoic acid system family protein [Methylomirabilota bacterium]